MSISRPTWIVFIVLSALSIFIWFKLSYPQLAFNHFTIDRHEALSVAKKHLQNLGVDAHSYQTAIIFRDDDRTNRYLQRTIGFENLKEFLKTHQFDMFFWIVRFFKEHEKEEYRLTISAETGEVTSFRHTIEDTAARNLIEQEEAQGRATQFLKDRFQFNPSEYSPKADTRMEFDNRRDYAFSWRKNSVNIPWSSEENSGTGKLLTSAAISGDEILSFAKHSFEIPDAFTRYMDHIRDIGQNLTVIVRIFYYILIASAIFYIIVRRHHLAMQMTKKFYFSVIGISIFLGLTTEANLFQETLFNYRTTQPFESYFWRNIFYLLKDTLFYSFTIMAPALAGELLHNEVSRDKKEGAFLWYMRTSFFSRSVASVIILGYFVCMIMLGIQSLLIWFGQRYLGVWVEYTWLGHLTTSYLPFLAAFTIGFQASFNEEILFRLYAMSWGKKIFKNTIIAAVIASLIWGFAHSNYPVFPSWFRGLEVTCLGFFIAFIYLNFGIIPVLVGHYLFDVFWNASAYLFGQAKSVDLITSLSVLFLPLFFALIACYRNQPEVPVELRWKLNRHQLYNLEILKTFLSQRGKLSNLSQEDTKKELVSHGWDISVVDIALEDLSDPNRKR